MSVFEKIAQRQIPAKIIWEDDQFIAFLDIQPRTKGHTLVAPKRNWSDYIFDLDADRFNQFWQAARQVAEILATRLDCQRVGIHVEGLEVDHVHIHLLPIFSGQESLVKPPIEISSSEMEEIYQKLNSTTSKSQKEAVFS